MAEEEKSLTWIVGVSFVLLAVVGWGLLAGSYAGAHATPILEMSAVELDEIDSRRTNRPQRIRRGAIAAFVGNSIEQLPNMPTVISWHFSNRIWLLGLIGVAMIGLVGGGVALKKVEQNLSRSKHVRR